MHRTDKYPQHSLIISPVWLNGLVFVYKLSGCGFESRCSHLNFIGYLCGDYKIKSLHKMLPNASASVKSYDGQTKCMYFSIKDNGLLNKYIIIWDNVSADIKKEFDSKPV